MKKALIAIGIIIILIVAAVLGLNVFFKNKISTFLDHSLSENIQLSHGDISVDSWQGTIEVNDILIKLKKSQDTIFPTRIKTEQVTIKKLSYWDYFVHKQIHIAKIKVGKNEINQRKIVSDSSQSKHSSPAKLNKQIIIDELDIGQTLLKISDPKKDTVLLHLKNATLTLKDIRTGPKIIMRKIPFTFDDLSMQADSLFLSLSPYDDLSVNHISMDHHDLNLEDLTLKTRYSREKLSKLIDKERDHIDLKIPQISINGIEWGFKEDSLFTSATAMSIHAPKLNMYRDKRVADDNTEKPLYSKMLRKLSIGLMLDSLKIDDASIVYSERVNSEGEPGQISFSELNIKGAFIGNTYSTGSKKTTLAIKGFFLDDAPIDINWSFDVNSMRDRFRFMAAVGAMNAARINNFTQPNLGAKMTGKLKQVYFDIDGDNDRSTIKMKMNYYNFKIEVLNKKSKKNWFVSTIANLFVSKDSKKNGEENFRNGEGSAVRDKTKSFFNYLWLNVKSGLVKAMVGPA